MTSAATPDGRVPPRSTRPRLLAALLTCLVAATCGVVPAAADDVQFWPTITVYTPTVDGWKASAELQARWTEDLETYNRTIYRLNAGRSITPRLELFGGWELTVPGTSALRREQRLWEQVEYTLRVGRTAFSNRARLEQRFVSGAADMASRLRYRFRVQHPLGASKWTLVASEELWLHLTSVRLVGRRGVDQNRVAFTAMRPVNPHLTIEPGYLRIDVNVPKPLPNRGTHAATVQLTFRF